MKRRISIALNAIYGLIVILILLDGSSILEMKSQELKTFIYWALMIGPVILLVWNALMFPRKNKAIGAAIPAMILVIIFLIGPITILFSSSAWKTDTVLFQSKTNPNKRIEYQMQDVGIFGYNRRVVEVHYLTKYFMVARDADTAKLGNEWAQVNMYVNEAGLKGG